MPIASWMPDWLLSNSQPFAFAVFCISAVFFAMRLQRRWHREQLDNDRSVYTDGQMRADAEVARARADQAAADLTHRAEIDRMKDFYEGQINRL